MGFFEQLEQSLLTDCDCYGCRNERVGISKAFKALRDRLVGEPRQTEAWMEGYKGMNGEEIIVAVFKSEG